MDVSKWVVPGVVTVILGTAATIALTRQTIESDLTARASAALQEAGLGWAQPSFDARDGTLTGLALDSAAADRALQLVAGLHGVRSMNSSMAVPETVSPYPFAAEIVDGGLKLTGGAPDPQTRDQLLARTGAGGELEVYAGAPNRDLWLSATDFVLRMAPMLESGSIGLSDLAISVDGKARDRESFDSLRKALEDGLPSGVTLDSIQIVPPAESPYSFTALRDGGVVSLSGSMPSEEALDGLLAMFGSEPVNHAVKLSSGEPEDFLDNARILLENLAKLDRGAATIVDREMRLSGVAPTAAVRDVISAELSARDIAVDLSVSERASPEATAAPEPESDAALPDEEALPADAPAEDATVEEEQSDTQAAIETPPSAEVAKSPDAAAPGPTMNEARAEGASQESSEAASSPPVPQDNTAAGSASEQPSESMPATQNVEPEAGAPASDTQQTATLSVPPGVTDPIDLCRQELGTFSAANTILFDPASAHITDESVGHIDELVGYLGGCPTARIHIEGHTDSDGPDDMNMALSVSRAEAVIDALIARGIAPERLYAVGYGETLPVATNATRQGKAQNRRIVFRIIED